MMRRSFVAALVVLALPAVPFAADSISDLGFDEIMVKNALFSNLRGWGSDKVPAERAAEAPPAGVPRDHRRRGLRREDDGFGLDAAVRGRDERSEAERMEDVLPRRPRGHEGREGLRGGVAVRSRPVDEAVRRWKMCFRAAKSRRPSRTFAAEWLAELP